jgi:hypothetical protein
MAKIFAEYFGGRLDLRSDGEETTVDLQLYRDPALATENIITTDHRNLLKY